MPLAQASGMGLNSLVGSIIGGGVGAFAYSFTFSIGQAFAMVLISGVIFLLLSIIQIKGKTFRELVFDGMPIAVRSAIVNYGSQIFNDPYWMTDGSYFMSPSRFQATLFLISKELSHSKEDFIIHFKTKYSNPYPPAWILAEILPLGIIMNVYYNIRDKQVKKKIANEFDLKVKPFESWMSIITLTRNSCCHHTRIWNKQNTMQPMEPKHITKPWIRLQTDRLRIYFNLCIIKWFLDCISPNNNLKDKITTLLDRFPSVDINAMGFPTGWLQEDLWKG
jgi:hypothetical protein